MKVSGFGFLVDGMKCDLEPIKKRHLEIQYLERDFEDLQKSVEQIQNSVQNDVLSMKNLVMQLQSNYEEKVRAQMAMTVKTDEIKSSDLIEVADKCRDLERRMKDVEKNGIEADTKLNA